MLLLSLLLPFLLLLVSLFIVVDPLTNSNDVAVFVVVDVAAAAAALVFVFSVATGVTLIVVRHHA